MTVATTDGRMSIAIFVRYFSMPTTPRRGVMLEL
jgi:hypothetical protein